MANWDDLVNQANNYVNRYNPNEQVNMQDGRLTQIESQRNNELNTTKQTYNDMINKTDQFYNNQNKIAEEYAKKQTELQNANTAQTINEINQNKEKTQRDYEKEQRGAYSDYSKQVNEYGVNAEVMASKGLSSTGYAESSKVSMYNAYQTRVATARQSLQDAMQSYDNQITQARLSNNTTLAEIAYNLAQAQSQNALEGFKYKNTLVESRENRLETINNRYDTKYNNMLNQLNQELANKRENFKYYSDIVEKQKEFDRSDEQFRQQQALEREQFNQKMAYQRERDKVTDAQWQKEYNLKLQQLRISQVNASSSSRKSSSSSGTRRVSSSNETSTSKKYNNIYNETIALANKAKSWSNSGKKRANETIEKSIRLAVDRGAITQNEAGTILANVRNYI